MLAFWIDLHTVNAFGLKAPNIELLLEPEGADSDEDAFQLEITRDVAKVSIVGLGMKHQPGIARRMFEALSGEGINIRMITTSDIKVSCLVKESEYYHGLAAIGREFDLFERE